MEAGQACVYKGAYAYGRRQQHGDHYSGLPIGAQQQRATAEAAMPAGSANSARACSSFAIPPAVASSKSSSPGVQLGRSDGSSGSGSGVGGGGGVIDGFPISPFAHASSYIGGHAGVASAASASGASAR